MTPLPEGRRVRHAARRFRSHKDNNTVTNITVLLSLWPGQLDTGGEYSGVKRINERRHARRQRGSGSFPAVPEIRNFRGSLKHFARPPRRRRSVAQSASFPTAARSTVGDIAAASYQDIESRRWAKSTTCSPAEQDCRATERAPFVRELFADSHFPTRFRRTAGAIGRDFLQIASFPTPMPRPPLARSAAIAPACVVRPSKLRSTGAEDSRAFVRKSVGHFPAPPGIRRQERHCDRPLGATLVGAPRRLPEPPVGPAQRVLVLVRPDNLVAAASPALPVVTLRRRASFQDSRKERG